MADLRKLKDQAAEHMARGRFGKASEALAAVVKADPRDISSRQKLGDALRKAGEGAEALRVYEDVAGRYARDGQLIKAIAICKIVLELDPRHAATQEMLADLYARRQGRARTVAVPAVEEPEGRVELPLATSSEWGGLDSRGASSPLVSAPPSPPLAPPQAPPPAAALAATSTLDGRGVSNPLVSARPSPPLAPPQAPPPAAALAATSTRTAESAFLGGAATPFEAIVEAAREEADEGVELVIGEPEPAAEAPPALDAEGPAVELPRIPLFSDLPHDAFVKLASRVALHRVEAGVTLLREGDAGASFFVIAWGAVRVERAGPGGQPLVLARLTEGSFFGEMAILSGEPRAATVLSESPCELLEIRADVLLDLAREHPPIVESLATFYRRRLLANAMATSPLFRPFGREERAALMGRFRSRELAEGTAVILEGEPADGLYVVLSGALDVWKRRDGEQVRAGQLREGDVFGEMSCLSKGPASASVSAARKAVLLRLPRAEFDELVMTYPQILELVSELSDERQHSLAAVAAGQAAFDDEGLLLT